MSRAFVKEADGDGPDELPELPLSPHPNLVTPEGLAALRVRRQALGDELGTIDAAATGAQPRRAWLRRELRWLDARLGSALVIHPERQRPGQVEFGAQVDLVDGEGRPYRYRIVGEDEADPEQGLISWVSPLARALKGAVPGDEVLWPRPAGDLMVEVLAIAYGSRHKGS
jgi:transcription elongation GreA/GreB family factor